MFINLYLNRFLGDMVPIMPLISLLLHDRGFSLGLISLFLFCTSATVLLFEIPFGVLADRKNPRFVLILSRLAKLASFSFLLFSFNVTALLLTAVFLGMASALDSGAIQSYTYQLTHIKNGDYFHKVYSRTFTSSLIGLLLAGVLAAQVGIIGFDYLQYIGICSLVLCLVSAILLPKISPSNTDTTEAPNKSNIFTFFKLKTVVAIVLCIGIFSGGIKGALDEYTALLLDDKGLMYGTVGYILLGLEIARTFGASVSSKFRIGVGGQITILAAVGLLFISICFGNYIIAVSSLFVVLFLDSILWVNNDVLIQEYTSNKNRSTLASIKNFGTEIVAGTIFGTVWLFGSTWGISQLYLYAGLILLFVSLVIFILHKSSR